MKERLLFQEPGLRTAEAEVPPKKAALRSTAVLGAMRPHGAASMLSVCHGEALTSTWQARQHRLARPTLTSGSEHL